MYDDAWAAQASCITLKKEHYDLPPAAADAKDAEIQADRRADRTWRETQLAAQDHQAMRSLNRCGDCCDNAQAEN